MKLKVTQENLAKALNHVARVANPRGTLPILGNVLLKIDENRLSISATNLDIAITSYIGAQIQKEGSVTVPAKLLHEFIAGLPSGVIEMEQAEQRVKITTDRYKSVINGVSSEDFPVMPSIENGTEWSLAAPLLKEALQQVLLAASSDESRPVLTGAYFHTSNGELYVASTDSYRLAERKLTAMSEEIQIIVPATALHDVLRIISDYSGDVRIQHDEQQIQFIAGDVVLVARLIEGKYPDYQKLIPQSFETTAELSRAECINITKITSLFARESAGSIVVSVDEPSESVWIHAVASQLGENNATAKAKITGTGAITLNSRYLLEALQAFKGDTIAVKFNGKLEPILISDPKSTTYKHIIMPLKS